MVESSVWIALAHVCIRILFTFYFQFKSQSIKVGSCGFAIWANCRQLIAVYVN